MQTFNSFEGLGYTQSQYNVNSANRYIPSYGSTSIGPRVLQTPTLSIINDAKFVSNENIIKKIPENTQLTATQDFNINQFTTEATTTNEQFITDQDFNLNQFSTEGTNEQFITTQYFNFIQFSTQGTKTNTQFIISQDSNLNQLTFDSGTNEQFTTLTQDSESN